MKISRAGHSLKSGLTGSTTTQVVHVKNSELEGRKLVFFPVSLSWLSREHLEGGWSEESSGSLNRPRRTRNYNGLSDS